MTTPQWLVERLAANDLPAQEAAEVRARLEAEGGLGRLADLETSNRQLLEQHPVATNIKAMSARRATPSRRAWLLVPALAVVAIAFWPTAVHSPEPVDDVTRIKGLTPRLLVHRQTGAHVELLADHRQASEGDRIQVGYVAAGRRFGAIISIDGRGHVTQHWPEGGSESAALAPSGEVTLPHAYVLDDAPGFERFVLLSSDTAFSLQPFLSATSIDKWPAPSQGIEQTIVQLDKVGANQ